MIANQPIESHALTTDEFRNRERLDLWSKRRCENAIGRRLDDGIKPKKAGIFRRLMERAK